MPWRGPRYEGEFPTLGWQVLEWMATYLPSPRDDTQPLILTDEQALKVLLWWAIDPLAERLLYRRWIQERAKGWGKGPMVGAIQLANLGAAKLDDSAPVVFDGWDSAGEPVGKPWGSKGLPAAWIQIAAVSEGQTDNTYEPLFQMLTANEHRAAIALGIDDGRTRLYLNGRPGQLEKVTASSGSREGQPITDAVLDETQLWTPRNGGTKLARTIRRNAAKIGGRTVETTNAPQLGEDSVAEASGKAAEAGAPGILYDATRPLETPDPSWSDKRLLAALDVAYGDSWWVDRQRLLADIRDPATPWDDAVRYFFNIRIPGAGKAVDPKIWDALAAPREVPRGTEVGLGFDGSINQDATFLRGCTRNGYRFLVGAWVRPPDAPVDWQVPRLEVHARLAWAMGFFHVGRLVCDPPKWWTEIETWTARYGKDVVVQLDTNQHVGRFSAATDRWLTDIRIATAQLSAAKGLVGPVELAYSHDGDPLTSEHVKNAHKRKVRTTASDDDGRSRYVIVKGEDRGRIDGAVAEVLAGEAAATMPEWTAFRSNYEDERLTSTS